MPASRRGRRRSLPSANGRTTVGRGAHTAELPLAHRDRLEFEGHAAGSNWQDLNLVFPNEDGGLLNPGNLNRRHFKPLLRAAGIDDSHRPYDLRHTMATLLLNAGVNIKTVSARLGHANIVLTLNTYAHW
jgi:integrase